MITINNKKTKNLLINTLVIRFNNLIKLLTKLFLKNSILLKHKLCLFKINNDIQNSNDLYYFILLYIIRIFTQFTLIFIIFLYL